MGAIMDLFLEVDGLVGDELFGKLILISLYLVVLINVIYNRQDYMGGFVAAGFITAMASIFLRIGGLVSDKVLFITISLAALAIIFTFFTRRD